MHVNLRKSHVTSSKCLGVMYTNQHNPKFSVNLYVMFCGIVTNKIISILDVILVHRINDSGSKSNIEILRFINNKILNIFVNQIVNYKLNGKIFTIFCAVI